MSEPPLQRTLKADGVKADLGLNTAEWRHVRVCECERNISCGRWLTVAQQNGRDYYTEKLNHVSWGSFSEAEKTEHCKKFREATQFTVNFIRCEGGARTPWASWYLLSVANSKSLWLP
jgi:hypothetical protein